MRRRSLVVRSDGGGRNFVQGLSVLIHKEGFV